MKMLTQAQTAGSEARQILFREDQQFRNPILWIMLVLITSALMGTAVFFLMRQLGQAQQAGTEPVAWSTSIALTGAVFVLNGGMLLALALAKLQVEVTTAGLFLRFYPLHLKLRKIDLTDVLKISAVQYHPVMEYGGYGIRKGRNKTAYNVSGNQGVRIDYDKGNHILIGTQYPEHLEAAIQRAAQQNHP